LKPEIVPSILSSMMIVKNVVWGQRRLEIRLRGTSSKQQEEGSLVGK
jgi:hypothetical protein